MSLYTGHHVRFAQLSRALQCLPESQRGGGFNETLELWQQWFAQGALQLGWVETAGSGAKEEEIRSLGATLWITDEAVCALQRPGHGTAAQRIMEAVRGDGSAPAWVMNQAQIRAAHATQQLNLLVLHFWSKHGPLDPEFQPVFVRSNMQFAEMHQGYGLKWLLQEVTVPEVEILTASGLKILRTAPAGATVPRVLLGLNRDDAHALPGSTLAFLFLSPRSRLDLRPSVQRMLSLALRQLTDEDIATALGCSRDYVRKLWGVAYEKIESAGVLGADSGEKSGATSTPRGRERRRRTLEFLRSNPQELRPGLPDHGC